MTFLREQVTNDVARVSGYTLPTSLAEAPQAEKGSRKKFHQPGIFSYSLKHDINSCKLTCFLKKTSSFHAKMKKFQVDRSSTIRYTPYGPPRW